MGFGILYISTQLLAYNSSLTGISFNYIDFLSAVVGCSFLIIEVCVVLLIQSNDTSIPAHSEEDSYFVCLTSTVQGYTGTIMFLAYCLDIFWRWHFISVSKVLLCATGDPMTQDCQYSDHPRHYVSPQPGIPTPLLQFLKRLFLVFLTHSTTRWIYELV